MENFDINTLIILLTILMSVGALSGFCWVVIKAVDELDRKFTNRYPKLGEDHD